MEWIEFRRQFSREVNLISDYLMEAFKKELAEQGHKNNGQLDASFEKQVQDMSGDFLVSILAVDYGLIVDAGVRGDRIPYGNPKSKDKNAYILGLVKWFKEKKGLEERVAEKAAFKTMRVHKREGMPTRNSYSPTITKNGRRLNFIDATIKEQDSYIQRLAETATWSLLETTISRMIDNAQKSVRIG